MAKPKLRSVNTKFWQDTYVAELDPIEKLLFLYILTSPLCNIAGVFEISLKRVAFDTGLDRDVVQRILERFERDNKIKYVRNHIVLMNFVKNQSYNEKMKKGAMDIIDSLPPEVLKAVEERDNDNLELVDFEGRKQNLTGRRKRIFERDKYTCKYCGEKEGELEIDHVIPLSKGGQDTEANLITACLRCNRAKHDKDLDEFVEYMKRKGININRYPIGNLQKEEDEIEEEDKYEVEKEENTPPPKIDYDVIKNDWNTLATAKKLNTIKSIDRKRKDKLKVRFSEEEFNLKEIFKIIPQSPFLCGVNERGWKVSFDWIIENSNNYLKILEGVYVNQKNGAISPFTTWRSIGTGKDSQLIEFDNEREVGKLKRLDGTGEPFRITKYELQKHYKLLTQ